MPNGDTVAPGCTFVSIRSFLEDQPGWSQVQSYLGGGAVPTFSYHRFWHCTEFALACAAMQHYFSDLIDG
jgi:hypothetical protein